MHDADVAQIEAPAAADIEAASPGGPRVDRFANRWCSQCHARAHAHADLTLTVILALTVVLGTLKCLKSDEQLKWSGEAWTAVTDTDAETIAAELTSNLAEYKGCAVRVAA